MAGPQYPVNLVLPGRSVLVVGAGAVAADKIRGLLDGGADRITVVAPRVSADVRTIADASGGAVTVEVRAYRSPEAAQHRLVVAAVDDPAVSAEVFADAEAAGVWVNAADDPANCTFTVPARVRRGDLQIAISTGGRSPAVARWLRERFEAEFGPEYDALLEIVGAEREAIRSAGRSTEGLPWQEAFDAGLLDLLRDGHVAEARELLRRCLSSPSE